MSKNCHPTTRDGCSEYGVATIRLRKSANGEEGLSCSDTSNSSRLCSRSSSGSSTAGREAAHSHTKAWYAMDVIEQEEEEEEEEDGEGEWEGEGEGKEETATGCSAFVCCCCCCSWMNTECFSLCSASVASISATDCFSRVSIVSLIAAPSNLPKFRHILPSSMRKSTNAP